MVLKVTTSRKELSWETKCGYTIMSKSINARVWNGTSSSTCQYKVQKAFNRRKAYEEKHNARVWNGTSSFTCQHKVQNASNRRKVYAHILGLTRTTTVTLTREGFYSEKCLLQ